jgi:3-oxoacyl-[acyl-carrier protein] reductase
MRPLERRVALVTGVGRRAGIGYATARRLLESGAAVLAVNPGPTETGWIGDEDPKGSMPLGRWGEPEGGFRRW